MAIKKLQNNFTTPEQSKRLLELGVPANSADCFYSSYMNLRGTAQLYHRPRFITEDNGDINWSVMTYDGSQQAYLPCWSVGRLMEIIGICETFAPTRIDVRWMDSVEYIINHIKTLKENECIDFSKLEE